MMGNHIVEINGISNALEKFVRALGSPISRGIGRQEVYVHIFYLV